LNVLSQRYAKALVDVAVEQGKADQVKHELTAFAALTAESADLRNFLASPAVPRPQKHAVVSKLVERLGASKTLLNFLLVLIDNRRASLLDEIQAAYQEQLYARLGVADVYVMSARDLSEPEKTELARALEKLTGKRVEAHYGVDPELIGGAVVRIGSTIYDGSVREQLNRMRDWLATE
jgi:F-type H+-transporting ATPase subunit delta